VAIASSANPAFADLLRASPLVSGVSEDFVFRAFEPTGGAYATATHPPAPGEDPLEFQQWNLRATRATEARAVQTGNPAVDVAILDTGIDVTHQDFFLGAQSNIDIGRSRSFVPSEPDPLVFSAAHGTSVASIVGARKNDLGMVGVAPNVTLISIKIVDLNDNARFSWVIEGITYAGDIQADVINMSLAIDEDSPNGEQPWCMSNPDHEVLRTALERAIGYARSRGALPVAAAGNGNAVGRDGRGDDLSADQDCDVMPSETPGVVTVGALDRYGRLTRYSNYGLGVLDLVAPGGDLLSDGELSPDECPGILTAVPGNGYSCGGGTSFAAPHVSGAAALVISQFGTLGTDGDMKMSPSDVEALLIGSSIDIGHPSNDKCYGSGAWTSCVPCRRTVPRSTRSGTVGTTPRHPGTPARAPRSPTAWTMQTRTCSRPWTTSTSSPLRSRPTAAAI
jgi:subtilisin family serine protease